MSSIDNRIVEMEFDNSQFEKGVATSMNSLQSLDDQLNTLGSGPAFSALAANVDDIANRFSTMGIVAMSIIENLTDRIVNLGINMVKSMTVDQITAGLQKFESITTSTIAIVNQADVTFEEAAGYIEKLAWYSDATSFDLNTMVSALKTFAAQGIDLERAIPVIMGIGNSVTFAGQSAKAGSAAFDAYAKAISTGYLDYRAWITLNRGLGIATMKLKQQLIDAAVAEGTLTKVGEGTWKTQAGLEVTLNNLQTTLGAVNGKWATTEVLLRLFGNEYGKLTNRISEYIDLEREETGYTLTLSEAYEKFGDQLREEFGPELYDLGKAYLDSATKARTFTEAIDAVKDAASTQFSNIFTSIFGSPEEAIDLWTEFSDFLNGMLVGPINTFSNVLKEWHDIGGRNDLINGIKALYSAFSSYLQPITEFIETIKPKFTGETLANLTSRFNAFAQSLKKFEPYVEKTVETISRVSILRQKAENLLPDIFPDANIMTQRQRNAQKYMDLVDDAFSEIMKVDEHIARLSRQERLENFINGIASALGTLRDILKAVIQPFKQLGEPLRYFADGMLTVASNLGLYVSSATEGGKITDWFTSRLEPLNKVIGWIGEGIKKLTDFLVKLSGGKVTQIFDKIGEFLQNFRPFETIFKGAGNILKNIAEGIISIAKGIKEQFLPVFDSGGLGGNFLGKLLAILLTLRTGIEGFDDLKFKGFLSNGSTGTTGFLVTWLGNLSEALVNLSDILEGTVKKIRVESFKTIAISLLLMAGAMLILASIKWEGIVKGIIGIAACLTMLTIAMKKMPTISQRTNSVGLLSLTASLLLVALSIKAIADIEPLKLLTALGAVTLLLAELTVISILAGKFGSKGNNLKGLVGMATAVLELTAAIAILGNIKTEKLIKGGLAVTGILGVLTVFMLAMSKINTSGMLATAAAVVLIAGAIDLMAAGMIVLGFMSWEGIAKGLVAIGALLLEIAGFTALMKGRGKDMAIIGAALIEISAALLIISAAMAIMGAIGWEGLQNGFLAFGIVLAEIGIFTALLSEMAPQMAIIGVALVAFSAALLVMAAAFTLLSAIGLPGITAAVLGVAEALLVFAGLSLVLTALWPVMLIGTGVILALSAALIVLGVAFEKIAMAALIWQLAFGKASSETVTAATNMSGGLETSTNKMSLGLKDLLSNINLFGSNATKSIDGTTTDIEGLVNGFGGDVTTSLQGTSLDINGIMNQIGIDMTSASSLIGSDMSISWKGIGTNLMQGLKNGISNMWDSVVGFMRKLGNSMTEAYQLEMGIYSPSRVFTKFGEYIDLGLIEGIKGYQGKVNKSSEDLGKSVIDSFSGPMARLATISDNDLSFSPKITPVLDTTKIQNGQNILNSMFSGRTLAASISGTANANTAAMAGIMSEVAALKAQVASMPTSQLNEATLSRLMASAMKNVDVYMDGSKVGRLVSEYQSGFNRASGI